MIGLMYNLVYKANPYDCQHPAQAKALCVREHQLLGTISYFSKLMRAVDQHQKQNMDISDKY